MQPEATDFPPGYDYAGLAVPGMLNAFKEGKVGRIVVVAQNERRLAALEQVFMKNFRQQAVETAIMLGTKPVIPDLDMIRGRTPVSVVSFPTHAHLCDLNYNDASGEVDVAVPSICTAITDPCHFAHGIEEIEEAGQVCQEVAEHMREIVKMTRVKTTMRRKDQSQIMSRGLCPHYASYMMLSDEQYKSWTPDALAKQAALAALHAFNAHKDELAPEYRDLIPQQLPSPPLARVGLNSIVRCLQYIHPEVLSQVLTCALSQFIPQLASAQAAEMDRPSLDVSWGLVRNFSPSLFLGDGAILRALMIPVLTGESVSPREGSWRPFPLLSANSPAWASPCSYYTQRWLITRPSSERLADIVLCVNPTAMSNEPHAVATLAEMLRCDDGKEPWLLFDGAPALIRSDARCAQTVHLLHNDMALAETALDHLMHRVSELNSEQGSVDYREKLKREEVRLQESTPPQELNPRFNGLMLSPPAGWVLDVIESTINSLKHIQEMVKQGLEVEPYGRFKTTEIKVLNMLQDMRMDQIRDRLIDTALIVAEPFSPLPLSPGLCATQGVLSTTERWQQTRLERLWVSRHVRCPPELIDSFMALHAAFRVITELQNLASDTVKYYLNTHAEPQPLRLSAAPMFQFPATIILAQLQQLAGVSPAALLSLPARIRGIAASLMLDNTVTLAPLMRCLCVPAMLAVHQLALSQTSLELRDNAHATIDVVASTLGRDVFTIVRSRLPVLDELSPLNSRVPRASVVSLVSNDCEYTLLHPLTRFAPHISVAPPSRCPPRLLPVAVSNGDDQTLLTSSGRNAASPVMLRNFGMLVVDLARLVPDGLLVLFPSYQFLRLAIEAWAHDHGILDVVSLYKSPIFYIGQPTGTGASGAIHAAGTAPLKRQATEFEELRRQGKSTDTARAGTARVSAYALPSSSRGCDKPASLIQTVHTLIQRGRGSVVFAVATSDILEPGLFAHDLCRTCLMIGLPEAENETDIMASAVHHVCRAAQAIIADGTDYAALVLADHQFSESAFIDRTPGWFRDAYMNGMNTDEVSGHCSTQPVQSSLTRLQKFLSSVNAEPM